MGKKSGRKRFDIAATFAVALLLLHRVAAGSDLVAVVDLEFIRATDQPAAVMCFGDKDEDCAVWATANLYRAKIRRVLSGVESRKTMLVLFGRHALKEKDFRGVIATMNRLEAQSERDPQYQIIDWGEKRELYCFPRREGDSNGSELRTDGEDSLTCYDAK